MQITTRFSWIVTFIQKIKLEYIALPIFVALSLFFYRQHYFSYIFMIIAATIGVFLFIVFDRHVRKKEMNISFELPDDKSCTLQLVTSILFFIFYGLSFLTLLQGVYTKTVWYYIFISLCAGVIAIEILFVKTKTQGTVNLIKSFLLALNAILSNQILFPYGIGSPDSYYHLFNLAIPIANNGYIPRGYTYTSFPVHHILVVISSSIPNIDLRMTYYCLGGLVVSMGVIFVFLIGRKFVNQKFGLFAALVYTCCDYLIRIGSHPHQSTYTAPLMIMLFTSIIYIYRERDWRFIAIYSILVVTLIFAHHFSAMVILIILASLFIVEIVQRFIEKDYKYRFPGLFLIYLVTLFAQWVYYSKNIGRFTYIFQLYHDAFTEDIATSIMTQTIYDQLPASVLLLNTLGSSILLMLSAIGFLYYFNNRSYFKIIIMTIAVTLSVLIGIGVVINISYLLPDRMYFILQLHALIFLGSSAIVWTFSNVKIKSMKTTFVIVLIMCLSFFSLSSTVSGFETSLFRGEQVYLKLYETPYERYSGKWADTFISANTTVKVSHSFVPYFLPSNISFSNYPLIFEFNTVTIDYGSITNGSYILFSKFDITTGFRGGRIGGVVHMGKLRYGNLTEKEIYLLNRFSKYYDCGMANIYYISESI